MADILRQLPLLPAGLLLATAIGLVVRRRLAQVLGSTAAVAWLLVVAVGLIVSATLTPLGGVLGATGGPVVCDMRRLTPPSLEALWGHDVWLNILLFMPLGYAAAFVRWPTRRRLMLAGVLLPFAIEGVQLALPAFGRGCQAADVLDNLIGLGAGLVIGGVAARTLGAAR